MAERETSIGGALGFAWSLVSQNWRAIWGVLALNALAWTVLFAGLFAARPELSTAGSSALIVLKYPLYGAIYRLALPAEARDRDPDLHLGPLGLQWRPVEFRIFIADILLSILLLVVFLLAAVAMSAVVLGVVMAQGGSLAQVTSEDQLM
jgi:hypothetical protein